MPLSPDLNAGGLLDQEDSRLKILMIFHLCPNPPPMDLGPAKRTFPFLREVVKRHEVSVLSFGSSEEEERFRKYFGSVCKRIEFVNNKRPKYINFFRRAYALLRGKGMFYTLFSRKMQKHIDKIALEEQVDLVHCSTALLGFYRFPKGVHLVGDTHNVEYDVLFRSFLGTKGFLGKAICFLEYKVARRIEVKNWSKFDTIIATTERDGNLMKLDLPSEKIVVIQNGVDPGFLEHAESPTEPKTMVFTGLMSYFPNNHGLLYFLDEVFPHVLRQEPGARLYVVGKSPSQALRRRASEKIIVTGFVDDVRPYIARGEIYIIPLLIGGGIRGKALEAMAMKKPIVSTSVGCEGILLQHGESVLISDTPQGFADSIVRLFNDPALKNHLASNAYRTVLQDYNWEHKGQQLEEVYQSLMQRGPTLARALNRRPTRRSVTEPSTNTE